MTSTYTVAYAPERGQYCVERPDGLRIFPMPQEYSDPDAGKRAVKLAEALNRMEAKPTTYEAPAIAERVTRHDSVEGSPEDAPLDETQADVARKLRREEA